MRGCRSHLRCVPVVLGGRPGPPLAALPENRPRRDLVAPVCLFAQSSLDERDSNRAHLLVRRGARAFARDLQRGLPRRAATSEDILAWKASAIATDEFLGASDGVDAGSAAVSIGASLPDLCRTFVTVLPKLRRRGVGSALLDASSRWAVEHDVRELEATVESDDEESIGFALRRGFVEHSRETGLELDVTAADWPAATRPRGSTSFYSRIVPSSQKALTTSLARRFPTSRDTRTGLRRRSSSSSQRTSAASPSSSP